MSYSHEANRLPPQDLDAERGVLGSAMMYSDCLDEITAIIGPEQFYLDAHRKIFEAMLRLRDRGIKFDTVTVSHELDKAGHLEEVGGDEYLIKVVGSVYHAGHAAYHAGIVREKFRFREMVYIGGEVLKDGYQARDNADEKLAAATDKLLSLMENRESRAESMKEVALRSIDRLTQPRPAGITLGFRELDERLGGAKPAQLIVIGARPGVGKSSLACNMIDHVSQSAGVFMASIEMTTDELFDKMLCSRLGVSSGELRPLARDEQGAQKVDAARSELANIPVVIDDATDQTVASIGARARMMKRKQGLGLVIVDYLQLVQPTNKREPRELQVGNIGWGLKILAKQLDVPVIALVQLNREIEKRPDKRPKLSDIRESGTIEQHAAVVMFLDRPGDWDPEHHSDEEAVLYVEKNRGGRKGKIDLKWHQRSGTFSDHFDTSQSPDDYFPAPGGDDLDGNF